VIVLAVAAALAFLASGVAGWLLWAARGSDVSVSSIRVEPPVFVREFGASGLGALRQPIGIAIDGPMVFVADAGRGDVAVFSTEGRFAAGLGAGKLRTPVYVALNPLDGYLYVSDRSSRSIEVFDFDGAFVETFKPVGAAGETAIRGWQPFALAFGDDGTLYVSDVGERQRVLAFGPAGEFRGETGDDLPKGATGNSLAFANGLAVTQDRILVADSNNSRMLYLTRGLRFVSSARFSGLPRGVLALDGGLAAVVDTTGGELRILGPDGATLASASSKGPAGGRLMAPTALAADGNGHVFVTDTSGQRVSVWAVSGARRKDTLLEAFADRRWWAVAAGILLTAALAAAAVVASRNRSRAV
jgi:DNA-binding beta-propeller fold protein YncE